MECFERAHVIKSSKSRKFLENKKKALKKMLYGYNNNDNKVIQTSIDLQNRDEDSTSVSGYSDLNLTKSSYEDENEAFNLIKDNPDMTHNDNINEKTYEDSVSQGSESYKSSEVSHESAWSNDSYDNESNEDKSCFSEASISEDISRSSFNSLDFVDKNQTETDTETSIVMKGLNLSESDISDFDADRQLAAKIQEQLKKKQRHKDKYTFVLDERKVLNDLVTKEQCQEETLPPLCEKESLKQIKRDKKKHKDKYTILLDSKELPKGPITKERCSVIQAEKSLEMNNREKRKIKKAKQKHRDKYNILLDAKRCYNTNIDNTAMLEDNTSISDDQLNENNIENSVLSPPYISITASDMSPQRLDDIVGEYKHSTIKKIPSEPSALLSTNNSGFFIEETMDVDMENDEVSSLIPEFDDIPKLEEIDEEVVNLDTTVESTDIASTSTKNKRKMNTSENDDWMDYDQVADTFKVYYGTKCCIITLKHPCELFIQGKVKIRTLGGTLEIFGYTLNKKTCDVYAPYYNFAQGIKTIINQNEHYGLFGKLTAAGLSVSEAEAIVVAIGQNDGVLLLQELNCNRMDFIENNFRVTSMFQWSKAMEPYFSKASDILNCSIYSSRPYKSFKVHPSWKEANELAMVKPSRGIVCGGKGTGKSTYVRYQVNKLLAHGPVLVVDLDPGQSLFTVAGSVSATVVTSPLIGPSFTHLRKPDLSLAIGIINTMDNAKMYASAVRTLLKHCHGNKRFADLPWIVNTMGMTNSLGLKFITLIISLVQPTYVLQYESGVPNQRFQTLLTPTSTRDLFEDYKTDRLFENVTYPEDLDYSFVVAHDADSPHTSKSAYVLRPKDERYLNFLAYFSQLLEVNRTESLLGITPYEVSLKDLRVATNIIVKREHLTKVLNGKLVALCHQTPRSDNDVFTLTDKPLQCLGHGLIRGIDWDRETLYVTTPVQGEELGGVDTLLYADWMPELMWNERSLPKSVALPYRTSMAEHHKQLMSTPRRRYNNPLQFMKMAGGAPN